MFWGSGGFVPGHVDAYRCLGRDVWSILAVVMVAA
jgi:hypothetical protein